MLRVARCGSGRGMLAVAIACCVGYSIGAAHATATLKNGKGAKSWDPSRPPIASSAESAQPSGQSVSQVCTQGDPLAEAIATRGFGKPEEAAGYVQPRRLEAVRRMIAKNEEKFIGRNVASLHWENEAPYHLMRDPSILRAVVRVLGEDVVAVDTSVFVKNAAGTLGVGWHQDAYSYGISGRMVAVMIAIDDITAENAPMVYLPGSHRNGTGQPCSMPHDQHPTGTLNYYNVIDEKELAAMFGAPLATKPCLLAKGEFALFDNSNLLLSNVAPLVSACPPVHTLTGSMSENNIFAPALGEFALFDSYLVHGGGPNHSSQRRAAMTAWFTTPYTTYTPVSTTSDGIELYRPQLIHGRSPAGGRLPLSPPVFSVHISDLID